MKSEYKRLTIVILSGAVIIALAFPLSRYLQSRGQSGEAPIEMAFFAGCLLIISALTIGFLIMRWLYRKLRGPDPQ
ncbi:MAG: hypothetical protein AB2L14_22025 [Candidatus Xenobiia bacterium LiM19]